MIAYLQSLFVLLQIYFAPVLALSILQEQKILNFSLQQDPLLSLKAELSNRTETKLLRIAPYSTQCNTTRIIDCVNTKKRINFDLSSHKNRSDENRNENRMLYQSHDANVFYRNENFIANANRYLKLVPIKYQDSTTEPSILTTHKDVDLPVTVLTANKLHSQSTILKKRSVKDIDDISLVPAGSNTRIQVKRGPNGKDYEYEYVYYYYDEDEGGERSNTQIPVIKEITTTSILESSPRQKNSHLKPVLEKTTVEHVNNEILSNLNESRDITLKDAYQGVLSSTRFPPRNRWNNTSDIVDITSPSRVSRQKVSTNTVSSFNHRSHESPVFPQNLPDGPIRFLGVTPNESNEEKSTLYFRTVQNTIPVQEQMERQHNATNMERSVFNYFQVTNAHNNESVFNKNLKSINPESTTDETDFSNHYHSGSTESETTESNYVFDKLAVDLYAFSQEGRSNLIGSTHSDGEIYESTFLISNHDYETTEPLTNDGKLTTKYTEQYSKNLTKTNIQFNTTKEYLTNSSLSDFIISTEDPNFTDVSLSSKKLRNPIESSILVPRNRIRSGSISPFISKLESKNRESSTSTASSSQQRGRIIKVNQEGSELKRSRHTNQNEHSILPIEEKMQKENEGKLNIEPKFGVLQGRGRSSLPRIKLTTKSSSPLLHRNKTLLNNTSENSVDASKLHRPSLSNKTFMTYKRRGNRLETSSQSPEIKYEDGTIGGQSSKFHQQNVENYQSFPTVSVTTTDTNILSKSLTKQGRGKFNLRTKPHVLLTTTTENISSTGPFSETSIDEPASAGTEEEQKEVLEDLGPAHRSMTAKSFHRLLHHNKVQAQSKSTTARITTSTLPRKAGLLPRRKQNNRVNKSESTTATIYNTMDEATAENHQVHVPTTTNSSTATSIIGDNKSLSSLLTLRRKISSQKSS